MTDLKDFFQERHSRRRALKVLGLAASVGVAWNVDWLALKNTTAQSVGSRSLIKHVLISCQENRSFDHYFGASAGRYGIPLGWSQPDGHGGTIKPTHFTSLSTPDVGHF